MIEDDIVMNPKRYIWFYRTPTSHATSLFYWKHQEKKPKRYNPKWQKMTLEDPNNLSSEHLALLNLWTIQKATKYN